MITPDKRLVDASGAVMNIPGRFLPMVANKSC